MNGKMQGVLAPLKAKRIGLSKDYYDSAWSVLNGEASSVRPDRQFVAGLMGGARNLEVVGKLQSAFINSLPDIATYFVASGLHKVPMLRATANLCKAWGSESKDIARRAGLMADALASNLDRFGQNNVGQGWTGMLANWMMKFSLLDQWTNGVRQASMINMMGVMSNVSAWDWNILEPFQKRQLERLGVTERDWKLWQAAKPYKAHNGARVLTRQDIREVDLDTLNGINPNPDSLDPQIDAPFTQRDVDHAVSTYVAFLRDESGLASLAPDLRTRALSNIAGGRGTFGGEVMRSVLLFKSFPIGFVLRHLERGKDLVQTRGNASATKYAAAVIVGSTISAVISVQLKQLIAGRDLQDMSDDDFWWQALSTGGGLSFLTDLIIAGVDGQNAYGSPNLLRFLGPVAGTMLDTWDVAKAAWNEGAYDKESSADAKALKLVRGHMPFVNLWYTKAVFDRAVYNDLMEFCSPGYTARVEGWAMKKTGQEYWWAPTKLEPTRMPKMATNPQD